MHVLKITSPLARFFFFLINSSLEKNVNFVGENGVLRPEPLTERAFTKYYTHVKRVKTVKYCVLFSNSDDPVTAHCTVWTTNDFLFSHFSANLCRYVHTLFHYYYYYYYCILKTVFAFTRTHVACIYNIIYVFSPPIHFGTVVMRIDLDRQNSAEIKSCHYRSP